MTLRYDRKTDISFLICWDGTMGFTAESSEGQQFDMLVRSDQND